MTVVVDQGGKGGGGKKLSTGGSRSSDRKGRESATSQEKPSYATDYSSPKCHFVEERGSLLRGLADTEIPKLRTFAPELDRGSQLGKPSKF